jgi:hypothetical protein
LVVSFRSSRRFAGDEDTHVRQYSWSVSRHHGRRLPSAQTPLVRGFITTPLERDDAAADGTSHQSQSTQGQSLITARLKLNYDANSALSDISSKVDAIRRDLPPDAEIPSSAFRRRLATRVGVFEFHFRHSSA